MKKDNDYINLRMNIVTLQTKYSLTDEELRLASRLSDSAFRQRKKRPGLWRYEELIRLANKLHTTVDRLVGEPQNLLKGA